MLKITIPEMEFYNEDLNEFFTIPKTTLSLEHSLLSVAKWEQKWHKSFINTKDKSLDEIRDYIRCMTLTQNVDEEIYKYIPEKIINQVLDYMQDPMTATTFREDPTAKGGGYQVITNELIYYWMVSFGIPFECQKWHLNRLLTLIRVCSIKNQPPKKMKGAALAHHNSKLNAERRARMHTRG